VSQRAPTLRGYRSHVRLNLGWRPASWWKFGPREALWW
jgi:hypothetical protein